MTLPTFPAVDDVLCDLLAGFGTTGLIAPAGLASSLPFVQPHIVGGNGTLIVDSAVVDVDVFAESIPAAMDIAGQIRSFLEQGGPHVPLDVVSTITRPRWIPYGLTGVSRVSATYRVTSRRS